MIEYDVETRKFSKGIKTKYNVNGTPKRLKMIDPKYRNLCQEIMDTHHKIIEQGKIEKIITLFST